MSERFLGNARLYGVSAFEKHQNSHIAVVGIGGVGSWAIEALARSGVGKLTLIDLDEICVTNVNRQLHAMDGHIGRLKIEAMAERARAINPDICLNLESRFFNEQSSEALLASQPDCVIDAIDSGIHKMHLVGMCYQRNIPVITCGAAGGRRDPSRIQVADLSRTTHDGLLLNLRSGLRDHYGFPKGKQRPGYASKPSKIFGVPAIYSDEMPVYPQCDGSVSPQKPRASSDGAFKLNCADGFGSSAPVTGTFGLIAAAEALKCLS